MKRKFINLLIFSIFTLVLLISYSTFWSPIKTFNNITKTKTSVNDDITELISLKSITWMQVNDSKALFEKLKSDIGTDKSSKGFLLVVEGKYKVRDSNRYGGATKKGPNKSPRIVNGAKYILEYENGAAVWGMDTTYSERLKESGTVRTFKGTVAKIIWAILNW